MLRVVAIMHLVQPHLDAAGVEIKNLEPRQVNFLGHRGKSGKFTSHNYKSVAFTIYFSVDFRTEPTA